MQFQRKNMGGIVPLGRCPLAGPAVAPGVAASLVAQVYAACCVRTGWGAWRDLNVRTGAGELLLLGSFCKGAGSPCQVWVCGQARKKLFTRGHSARKA